MCCVMYYRIVRLSYREHQSVEKEIKQNRKLAEDHIDAGYYSLAQKLHPDRGG